jgi:hypothetical protein
VADVNDDNSSLSGALADGLSTDITDEINVALDDPRYAERLAAITSSSLLYSVLFVVYCIAIYWALKLALKNDLIFGCISLMRRKGCSVTTTMVLLFIHLFITVFGPLAIGILWWFKVS